MAYDQARYVFRMRMFGASDAQIRNRPSTDQVKASVVGLMIDLTDKHPKITEQELATEGYAYCVARKQALR